MKCSVPWWGVFCFMFHYTANVGSYKSQQRACKRTSSGRLQTKCCKEHVRECLRTMEEVLMKTEVNQTTSICANSSVAVLHKPPSSGCNGLEMYVSEPE
ncbi:hypothetical protein GOODEAATRI_006398, partial [Goodea atripinnis]